MINWNVTFDEDSFKSGELELDSNFQNEKSTLRELLVTDVQLAGKEWSKYLSPPVVNADIDVRIVIDESTERMLTERNMLFVNTVDLHRYDLNHAANVWMRGAAFEINTGVDPNTILFPDIVIHVNPNALKNDFWLNPITLPADKADAVSAFAHEIGHALAFNGFRPGFFHGISIPGVIDWENPIWGFESTFDEHLVWKGDALFFNGENAKFVWHGNPVPLNWQAGVEGSDPYHLEGDLAAPALKNDLMSSGTTYRFQTGTRYDISNLDLAILADSGVNVDAPLTRAPSAVTAVSKGQSSSVDQWFAAKDPNGDQITWYALLDDNDDPNSGHFWTPNVAYRNTSGSVYSEAGDQKAKEVIYIPASDFHSTQFVSGSVSSLDDLHFSAYDGDTWGPQAHLTFSTALPTDLSLIA